MSKIILFTLFGIMTKTKRIIGNVYFLALVLCKNYIPNVINKNFYKSFISA